MTKWKLIIILFIFLILIKVTLPCKQRYDINENVIIIDVIESSGSGSQCNLSLFDSNRTLNQSGLMNRTGLSYSYNATILSVDTYSASIECNNSGTVYLGECKFKVGDDVEMWDIAGIVGMLGIILIFIFLIFHFRKKATDAKADELNSGNILKDAIWFSALELFFIVLVVFLTILLNNTARLIASDSGATASVLSMFDTLHIILIVSGVLFTTLILLRFLTMAVSNFRREALEKQMGKGNG